MLDVRDIHSNAVFFKLELIDLVVFSWSSIMNLLVAVWIFLALCVVTVDGQDHGQNHAARGVKLKHSRQFLKYACVNNDVNVCTTPPMTLAKFDGTAFTTRGLDFVQRSIPMKDFNIYKAICESKRILESGCGVGRSMMEAMAVNPALNELRGLNKKGYDYGQVLPGDTAYLDKVASIYDIPRRCVANSTAVKYPNVSLINDVLVDGLNLDNAAYDFIYSQNALDIAKVESSDSYKIIKVFAGLLRPDGGVFLGGLMYSYAYLYKFNHPRPDLTERNPVEKLLLSLHLKNSLDIIPIKYIKVQIIDHYNAFTSDLDILVFAFQNTISMAMVRTTDGRCGHHQSACALRDFMRKVTVIPEVELLIYAHYQKVRGITPKAKGYAEYKANNVFAAEYMTTLFAELTYLEKAGKLHLHSWTTN